MDEATAKRRLEGEQTRREVLGHGHVDRVSEQTDDLDRAFQDLITDAAWGSVWARSGLDRRTRSLITIALLAADGRDELDAHLRAAPELGVTPLEISEALLHVAIYAGFPAASHGYRRCRAILGTGVDSG